MEIYSNGLIAYMLGLISLLGLCMGSFLNCFSYRISNQKSIHKGRSHCPKCNHVLGILELIPIFSFVAQGGKCKNCKAKISIRYPLAEIITMVVFLTITIGFSYSIDTIKYLILASIFLVAVFSDMETMMIPDQIPILAMINWIIFTLLDEDRNTLLKEGFIGGIGFLIGMILLVKLADTIMKKDTMGGADVKLLTVTGFYFGLLGNVLLLMISCLVGIIVAMITGKMKTPFPFGPSIGIATWFTILYGDNIVEWYLKFF